MTLIQTLTKIRQTVEEKGTEVQKAKLASMGVGMLDQMVHVAQSMGVSSAISMYLGGK